MWIWVSTALLATVLTLGLLAILVNLKKKAGDGAQQPNHRAFFFKLTRIARRPSVKTMASRAVETQTHI